MFHFDLSLPIRDPVLVFSLVLLIILLAPIVLTKLRIPSLVGLILAGMAVGPHGFNILRRDSSIILFGTVGLLYIMFLAALELDLNQLRKHKYRSFLFGALTFVLPFVLGVTACRFLLGFDPIASILVASMFSTHTLVAYPVVSYLGLAKNPVVPVTVGGTVITDTLVLLILAVITTSRTEGLSAAYWTHLGISVTLFACVVFVIFPLLVRWFFRNLKGGTSHFIFVLFLVFLAAFMAKVAGMEPIIGAFAAGLTLNRFIPHASSLMNRIEFIGHALFIPFFLIGVGMLVDLKILLLGPKTLFTAFILTFGAIGGKWLAALVTQKILGYSRDERILIFGLSSSHAAATLAVILVGFNLGIVDEIVLNATIILILVSCLIATIMTEKAGKRLAILEAHKEHVLPEIRQKILVPVANPLAIEMLLDFAIMIQDVKSKQHISLLTVVQDDEEAAQRVVENKKMFERAVRQAAAADAKVEVLTRVDINATSGIARTVKELGVTDIIIGWSGQSRATSTIFGTTLDGLLKNTRQTVFVCHLIEPINLAKRVSAFIPPYAEIEQGFVRWVHVFGRLSSQVGAKVSFLCSIRTREAIEEVVKKDRVNMEFSVKGFDEWHDFHALTREVNKGDLILLVSAREGSISHESHLDDLPARLARSMPAHNFVVVYPGQDQFSFYD